LLEPIHHVFSQAAPVIAAVVLPAVPPEEHSQVIRQFSECSSRSDGCFPEASNARSWPN
jgi:hypothetical protein